MATPRLIRDINQVRVLDRLRRNRSRSRAELAHDLGLTRSTLTSLISDLVTKGYVTETGEPVIRRSTGRPGVGLKLNAQGAYFIGADLGVGRLTIVLLNLATELLDQKMVDFDETAPPHHVIQQLVELIKEFTREKVVEPDRLQGVGVTVPATHAEGKIVLSPMLGWNDIDIRSPLEAQLGMPVFVENDANASALAELYMSDGASNRNLLYLFLGAGIGAGIVINGQIYRGSFGAAGEVGYMRLTPDGPADRKGSRGTFEAYAGLPSILAKYHELSGVRGDLEQLVADLNAATPVACQVVQEWGDWLAQSLVGLVNILNPDRIVLGGPLSPLIPFVYDQILGVIRQERLPGSSRVEIEQSRFGPNDNAVGGAILAYHSLFSVAGLELADSVAE